MWMLLITFEEEPHFLIRSAQIAGGTFQKTRHTPRANILPQADSGFAAMLYRQRTSRVDSQRSHFVFGRSQVQISSQKLAVVFSSVPPSKCGNVTFNYYTTAFFHIPSNFSCSSHPKIRCFIHSLSYLKHT